MSAVTFNSDTSENMIEINDLTMQYPTGKGIFNVTFNIPRGSVVGFLGPNGAGKTTTIRCLLGFMQGQKGHCTIDKRECFSSAPENCKHIGFIAGEPSFPESMTGTEYLQFLCDIRKIDKKNTRIEELLKFFELDASGKIKRMSKGMKQKVAIIAAFMHDPDVYILDEPSSGLDPLMQNKFIDLLISEKKRGKTILISSHMFEEIERTSDEIVIIKDGRIVARNSVANFKNAQRKVYIVQSKKAASIKLPFETKIISTDEIEIAISGNETDKMIKALAKYEILALNAKELSLESIFLNYYNTEEATR